MKIIDLYEELAEFENPAFESKKAEISHLERKKKAIEHKREILYLKLLKLVDQGIAVDSFKKPLGFIDLLPGNRETGYKTYSAPPGHPEATNIKSEFQRLESQYKEFTQRIKDLMVRGNTYCFTGFRSDEMERKIKQLGGTVVSSAIQNLDYLIAADPSKRSGKMLKAQQNGAKIIGKGQLEDFLRD